MVQAIYKFTQLKELHLSYEFSCAPAAPPELPCNSFPNLAHLTLDTVNRDEAPNTFAYLAQLSCLRHLRLCGGAPARSCLAGFTQLTGLELDSANIKDVQRLSALCSLKMHGQPTHSDVGLMACMTQLTHLHVERMDSLYEPSQRQIRCQLDAVIDLCSLTNLKSLLLGVIIDHQEYEANLDLDEWNDADLIVSTPATSLSIAMHCNQFAECDRLNMLSL